MAARLSSTGISHHSLLSHIPSIRLSPVDSSPRPGIAPQSLNSSSQPLCHLGYVWLRQGCLTLIPFRLPQMSCFTLSLKCFSSDSDNCPAVGIGPLLQFPHPPRAGPALLTLPFFPLVPSSYRVLHGSIYYFPLVRNSCLLSAGILDALLCLKVYSWCIHGERCTPCPPTSLPSCSPQLSGLFSITHVFFIENLSYHVEKEMATHSGILAWRIPGTGEPGCCLWGHTESDMTAAT